MDLYFLRHGKAADVDGIAVLDDFSRPLTRRGIEELEAEADALRRLGIKFDLILTSPLVRAKQTAELVAQRLELGHTAVETDVLAPGCELDGVEKLLRSHEGRKAVLLVGHEPDLSTMVGELIAPRGAAVLLKKAGLARVEVARSVGPGKGVLRWLAPPSLLLCCPDGER